MHLLQPFCSQLFQQDRLLSMILSKYQSVSSATWPPLQKPDLTLFENGLVELNLLNWASLPFLGFNVSRETQQQSSEELENLISLLFLDDCSGDVGPKKCDVVPLSQKVGAFWKRSLHNVKTSFERRVGNKYREMSLELLFLDVPSEQSFKKRRFLWKDLPMQQFVPHDGTHGEIVFSVTLESAFTSSAMSNTNTTNQNDKLEALNETNVLCPRPIVRDLKLREFHLKPSVERTKWWQKAAAGFVESVKAQTIKRS